MSKAITYRQAGVDIDVSDQWTETIKGMVRRTYGPRVLSGVGGFAGLFRLDYDEKLFKKNYRNPVLVACTDGVGSKVQVAAKAKRFDTVGIDLVAMSVNDMLVLRRRAAVLPRLRGPAQARARPVAQMVKGVAAGCAQSDCALLGGETAEMPDTLSPGRFRPGGLRRRRGREGPDHHGQERPAGRCRSWAWAPPACTATATPWPGPSASNETSSS